MPIVTLYQGCCIAEREVPDLLECAGARDRRKKRTGPKEKDTEPKVM